MENIENVYPIRNCEYEINNNLVTVLFKKKKLTFIERTFFKKMSSKPYKIDLDEIGSFIWQQCDGKKNIGEIIEESEKHFNDELEQANERVELFVKQLNKNKLISLYEKKETK